MSDLTAILEGPALEPPPGVIPNFDDPGGSHAIGYFTLISCGILTTIAVILRLASRFAIGKINIEEFFLVSAFVSWKG